MRHALSTLSLVVVSVAACGPVEGPWGTIGGAWKYECDAPRDAGEPCGEDGSCAANLYCKGDTGGAVGTCAAKSGNGASCDTSFDCQSGYCKGTPLDGTCYLQNCDANGVCTQGAASGSKCNPPALDCPSNQICALGPTVGTCAPAPTPGQPCGDAMGGSACAPGLVCQRLTLVCVAPPAAGEYCGFGPTVDGTPLCASGLACRTSNDPNQDGRCGVPVALGAACMSAGECAPGAYCDLGKLVCTKARAVGESCKNGNECGEQTFDNQNGRDCVGGECVDTTKVGADCWPGVENRCKRPLACVPKDG
jgi:hypothetical protein